MEGKEKERELIPGLRNMSTVEAEHVKWVWYPYIPAGKLTMLEGDPGLGKSWISCDIATRLSRGWSFPGEPEIERIPQNALLLSAEDGLADTLKPRLDTLGADYERIFASETPFELSASGLNKVYNTLVKSTAAIVFMDPVVGYMGSEIDMHRANEVRGLMSKLSEIAKQTGAAIVGVRHLRKQGGTNAKYLGIGSIDFTAAARSAIQVRETKGGLTYMEHVKHNLSPAGPALRYAIIDNKLEWLGAMDWEEEAKARKASKTVSTKSRHNVGEFLHSVLKDGPVPSEDVLRRATEAGIPTSAVLRERGAWADSAKVGKQWVWSLSGKLPSEDPASTDPLLEEVLRKLGRGNVQ